jgi:hypothetical protein
MRFTLKRSYQQHTTLKGMCLTPYIAILNVLIWECYYPGCSVMVAHVVWDYKEPFDSDILDHIGE